jgi:hypothetical protein
MALTRLYHNEERKKYETINQLTDDYIEPWNGKNFLEGTDGITYKVDIAIITFGLPWFSYVLLPKPQNPFLHYLNLNCNKYIISS